MNRLCPHCGKPLADIPLDLAFRYPEPFVRARRSGAADHGWHVSSDLVSGPAGPRERHFVRAIAPVRVHNIDDDFAWGLWAEVDGAAFELIAESWDADGREKAPFRAVAANKIGLPGYEGLEGHPAVLRLGGPDDRPMLTLDSSPHLLAREQAAGISLERVHEIMHLFDTPSGGE